jgi:dTDP-4-dehydrorhamnose reductase
VNAIKPPLSTDMMEEDKKAAYAANTRIPENLALLQKKRDFVLLHISSGWVYEGKEGETYAEESLVYPKNYYSFTKALAEERIVAQAGNHLILRTDSVFGIDSKGTNLFLRMRDSEKKGKPVLLASDQFSQPICAGELARVARLLLKKKERGIFNVVGPDYMDRYSFGRKVCERFGFKKTSILPFLSKERPIPIPRFLKMSIKKAEGAVGKIRALDKQFDEFEREWLNDVAKA